MNRCIVKLLDRNVDTFNFEEALEYAKNISGQIVTINPEMFDTARADGEFAKILDEAELVIPDGIGVKIGLKIKGLKANRIAGIEFAHKLMETMPESIALVGAKPEVIKLARENLFLDIKDLNIAYTQDGYFKDDEIERIYKDLENLQPRLLLVALGSPKQEKFIYNLKSRLPKTLMIGIGGSFDVWAGVVERAPEIYQKLGLEWLYRTVKQPERIKRIFPTLPLFVISVIKDAIATKK